MPELRPPEEMPHGNVGTPTMMFLDMIQKCLLPNDIIHKLRLKFPSTQAKRLYSNVNFKYDSSDHILPRQLTLSNNSCSDHNRNKSDHCAPLSSGSLVKRNRNKLSSPEVPDDSEFLPNVNFSAELLEVGAKSHDGEILQFEKSSSPTSKTDSDFASFSYAESSETRENLNDKTESHLGGTFKIPELENVSSSKSVVTPSLSSSSISLFNSEQETDGSDDLKQVLHEEKSLTRRERKRLEKQERRKTKALMDERIEERLIQIEKRYHNDDDAEEWDRHEATEDDPSNQERNKERLYEEEIEQPWEKGGPGVVFYTDAMYWQAKDGDFDEQTADDLDVDFSPYEGEGPGDKDIRDFLKIRQEKRFRDGYDKTDRFSIGIGKRLSPSSTASTPSLTVPGVKRPSRLGRFECHTKGIGRKLMERQGWQDGRGLGASGSGIKDALRGDGQNPRIRKGLGFVESEPVRYGPSVLKKARVYRSPVSHLITTTKDDPQVTDPKEPLLQRSEPTRLKHRQVSTDTHSS